MPPDESARGISARPLSVVPVPLTVLADHLDAPIVGAGSTDVTGVALASSSVRAGDLYAALPGSRHHGAQFAREAAQRGAVALLTDDSGVELCKQVGLPTLLLDQPRHRLGDLAALVYGFPARSLTLVGVTGTQGKTTTTQLVSAGLQAAGRRTAVIGTMGTWIEGAPVTTSLTTPEAPDLHALFAVMVERGVDVCTMEVSSHALVMGRVDGVVFDLAVFTNFGRDHLDFHVDLESYFAAKAELFTAARARRALINGDDAQVSRLLDEPALPTSTFSVSDPEADWSAGIVDARADGSRFVVSGPQGLVLEASIALPGAFNVSNALCALAAVGELGCDVTAAARGIAAMPAVRGRMERVEQGQPFAVLVDYAHKPDAVSAALEALRAVTSGRVFVVIGAGGDRDAGKRPVMGQIAARLADVVIVTDDNPRSEDAAAIRAELLAGARGDDGVAAEVLEVPDRATAIRTAIESACAGDAVLIAGKGHEQGQETAGRVLPFDDREVARQALAGQVSAGMENKRAEARR